MGFNPISYIKGLFTGQNGIINDISSVVDKFITTSDEKKSFMLEVEKLLQSRELVFINDINSARELQKVSLGQDDKFSKRFIYMLAAISIIATFTYLYFVTFTVIPEENRRFADTILGVLISSVFGKIYSFFFGSSLGSKRKTELINTKSKSDENL